MNGPADVNPGLGPLYNNVSCSSCHIRDGRGMPVLGPGPLRSHLLVRVSLPEGEPEVPGGSVPVPGLGTQVQDQAVYGMPAEASVRIDWEEQPGSYADGAAYSLRRPKLTITLADGTPLPEHVMTSLRLPPAVFGLGLLEAIPEDTLLALADPDDADGDGISGRVNRVWDPQTRSEVIGRFGHKANTADLHLQSAAAYANDIGISNDFFPDSFLDIPSHVLDEVTVYTRTLGVPARTALGDEEVIRGEALFASMGCASCHVDTTVTGPHGIAALTGQVIHAYTDMLLHDMGPGLADGRPDFEASGTEWRTTPLWGLGLVQTVLPYSGYLHDGRARSIAEAILWHGGEARPSRNAFRSATADDRAALLRFLGSL